MTDDRPWTSRFNISLDDAALRRALRVKISPVENLGALAPQEAAMRLRVALERTFVATTQIVQIVRYLTETARGYTEISYPNDVSVLNRIYQSDCLESQVQHPAICMMGLAGTGKSQILSAFARLHHRRARVSIPNHSELELQCCWTLRLRDRATLAELLLPNLRNPPENLRSKLVAQRAPSELAAQGVAILLADEFQFVTGSDANVLASKLILQLASLGPPLVYACNFSLVNRLWKRPQQERDRILSRPILVQPEPLGRDWNLLLKECFCVSAEFSRLHPQQIGEALHGYSFGIKRALKELLILSYLEMRLSGESHVNLYHVEQAYGSAAFASMRSDVEELSAGDINPNRLQEGHRPPVALQVKAISRKIVEDHPAKSQHEARKAQAALESMVSPEGRELLDKLKGRAMGETKVAKRPARPPANVSNLIGGAQRFAGRQGKTGRSTEGAD